MLMGMGDGYTYEFEGKRNWKTSGDEKWETVMFLPLEGGQDHVGFRYIDGTQCAVFKCADGKFRAQSTVHVRMESA